MAKHSRASARAARNSDHPDMSIPTNLYPAKPNVKKKKDDWQRLGLTH
jgi:hypothetical protein